MPIAQPLARWINKNNERCIAYISKFHELYIIEPESQCWTWIGGADKKGMPSANYPSYNDGFWRVALLSWSFYKGDIPSNLDIVKLCKNNLCINPDHHKFISKADIHAEKMEKVNRIRKKAETLSIQQIAIEEKMSYQTAYNIVRGVSFNKGEEAVTHPIYTKKYKISEDMYPDIAYKLKEGIKIDNLAKEYQVSYTTMYKVTKLIRELGI